MIMSVLENHQIPCYMSSPLQTGDVGTVGHLATVSVFIALLIHRGEADGWSVGGVLEGWREQRFNHNKSRL